MQKINSLNKHYMSISGCYTSAGDFYANCFVCLPNWWKRQPVRDLIMKYIFSIILFPNNFLILLFYLFDFYFTFYCFVEKSFSIHCLTILFRIVTVSRLFQYKLMLIFLSVIWFVGHCYVYRIIESLLS